MHLHDICTVTRAIKVGRADQASAARQDFVEFARSVWQDGAHVADQLRTSFTCCAGGDQVFVQSFAMVMPLLSAPHSPAHMRRQRLFSDFSFQSFEGAMKLSAAGIAQDLSDQQ